MTPVNYLSDKYPRRGSIMATYSKIEVLQMLEEYSSQFEPLIMPNEVLTGRNLLKKFDEEIKKEKIEIENIYEATKIDAINEGLRLSRIILKELLDNSQHEA